MDGVTKMSHDAPRALCGVGYVILSKAQDRDTYIGSCFRNNTITIITSTREIIKQCVVCKSAWQDIEFPNTTIDRGSLVAWVNVPFQNKVMILGVLTKRDELNPIQSAGQFKFQRKVGDNIVTVQGDGTTGIINIIAQGAASGEGEVYMKVLNPNELGIFSLYVQGNASLEAENEADFKAGQKLDFTVRDDSKPENQANWNYILGTGFAYLDEFKNNLKMIESGILQEVPGDKKVYARASGAASQPGLLGDATTTLLGEIKSLLTSIVTTLATASAPGPNVSASPVAGAITSWTESLTKMAAQIKAIKAQNFELS